MAALHPKDSISSHSRSLAVLAASVTILSGVVGKPAAAQSDIPDAIKAAQTNSTSLLDGLQVKASAVYGKSGGAWKFSEAHEIILRGQTLDKKGEAVKNTDALAQFDFIKSAPEKAARNGFILDLASGSGAVDHSLINFLGKDKFSLPKIPVGKQFSAVTRLDGQLNGKEVNFAYGLEGPSWDVPIGKNAPGRSAWFLPGVALTHNYLRDGKDKTSGQLTGRLFFGTMKTGLLRPGLPFTIDDVFREAGDFTELQKFEPKPNPDGTKPTPKKTDTPELTAWLKRLVTVFDGVPTSQYRAEMEAAFNLANRGRKIAPSRAFWVESDAWYTFAGDPEGRRFDGLLALVGTQYFGYKEDGSRSSFEVRGEYGHDRADLTEDLVRVRAGVSHTF
jgi:hypothetical protein